MISRDSKEEMLWVKLSMISVCRWMGLLPLQTFVQRQNWVMAVSDYMSGYLTVMTRVTVEFLEVGDTTDAVIVGRTTYDLSVPYWGADGPLGSARIPTVVVTHRVPDDIPDGSVYIFADSIAAAIESAKQAAADKDIGVAGANIAQQLITHGFIDEILVHVVPVLFGSGVRFFERPDTEHIPLETIEVIETKEVVHFRFRIVK